MKYEELQQLVENQQKRIEELEEKLEEKEDLTLTEKVDEIDRLLKNHKHQGDETPLIYEGITTVSTAPSGVPPKRLTKQIYIYVSGATKRLYIYDFTAGSWYYCALS